MAANDGPPVPRYPDAATPELGHRSMLHPLFNRLTEGISELTFANLYLFRHRHAYRFSTLPDGHLIVLGNDKTVEDISTGGFTLDVPFTATGLREPMGIARTREGDCLVAEMPGGGGYGPR